jgi:hypothetical protein
MLMCIYVYIRGVRFNVTGVDVQRRSWGMRQCKRLLLNSDFRRRNFKAVYHMLVSKAETRRFQHGSNWFQLALPICKAPPLKPEPQQGTLRSRRVNGGGGIAEAFVP